MKNNVNICVSPEAKVDRYLDKFSPITLEEMKSFELLDRVEIKYLIELDKLFELLDELPKFYKILKIGKYRKTDYRTIYFDTPDFKMYKEHHNGRLNRYKIRVRKYMNSGLSFIEIKFKDNKEKTFKKRIQIPENFYKLEGGIKKFIQEKSPFETKDLSPVLFNNYTRITLVSKKNVERVTIDINLEFFNKAINKTIKLPNLAIIEIKQEKFSKNSDIVKLMREKSIRSNGLSKYCIGAGLIYDGLKTNNFKEKLMIINKLNSGSK
ncbi:MAG: polyphosphate polymerase domain-containing protein [Flavobacterium sp.]|uniref:polyphosphate polymerase domain-containing protein n=1 Tax=Flavobacterium sp. TaxID=239 RepID=UPI002635A58D|nr:polyphosphate polymerase domain-containing protein [Flavobacterium sp.]MDD5151366.1 polyphosphate polymerase domain-containing protein [Flavobacterium sp.]